MSNLTEREHGALLRAERSDRTLQLIHSNERIAPRDATLCRLQSKDNRMGPGLVRKGFAKRSLEGLPAAWLTFFLTDEGVRWRNIRLRRLEEYATPEDLVEILDPRKLESTELRLMRSRRRTKTL
jgi:hypothetical protein